MPFCRNCGNQIHLEAKFCSRCNFPSDIGQEQPIEIAASSIRHKKHYSPGRFTIGSVIAMSCIAFAAFVVIRTTPNQNTHQAAPRDVAGTSKSSPPETSIKKAPETCEEQIAYIAPISKTYADELNVYLLSRDAQSIDSRMDGLANASRDFSKSFTGLSPDRCGDLLNFLKDESLVLPMFTQVLTHRPRIDEGARPYASSFLSAVVTDGEADIRENQPIVLNDWLLQVEKDYCRIRTANFALQAVSRPHGSSSDEFESTSQDCEMHKLARGR